MPDYDFDLFTIGAGSGGVRASRVAAAHGAKVAVAEEYRVGGTCVIRGCVPKKMLVYGAQFAEDLKDAKQFGWDIPETSFDWPRLRDLVQNDVTRLNGLYTETLDKHNVTIFHERAEITGDHQLTLASGKIVTAKYILIATGGEPARLTFPGSEFAITSNEAFHLEQVPPRILIAGGGYIANEFAGIFHEFGSKVSMVNRGDRLLRSYDDDIAKRLLAISREKGIQFHFNTTFKAITKNDDGSLRVELNGADDGASAVDVDCVMFAAGRTPHVKGLGLETIGVEQGKSGEILVDEYSRTNVDYVYAVGDVTNRVQLTPVAIREGQAFADTVFNNDPKTVSYDCIASAVFCHPPIAAVGMTEEEARSRLGEVKVYQSDFRPMKNVVSGRAERGLYKMIVDAATDKVVGIHMIGPDSAEIMQGFAVAVKAGLTKADFDAATAIHPTMAEELVLLK